ncbi:unnamed protein product [Rotaria sp. Silwood2]|nr:unnamed protein product [Rotaria sp. Silwood2]CAF3075081.1 unnamed protein product [Rotaria sp. Silwood2]CAF3941130.1 unnamed protein product [Rotaria sp. Silwood2]CAF3949761.1 unnamed protein product [Rotaria sp. Silwood2]CAF4151939.1 unnamed protein product [Rotaria sp. Silwood2]
MSHDLEYEYENESSIDSELICAACLNPFNKPTITSCGHIFCLSCIKLWLKKDLSCPICRKILIENNLKPVTNQNILNKLDQLPVKCTLCQQTHIKRKRFDYHKDKRCQKVIVLCSAADMKCPWKGQRIDLRSHEMNCSYCSNQKLSNHQVQENATTSSKLEFKQIIIFLLIKLCLELMNSHSLKIESIINQYPLYSKISLRNQYLTDDDIPIVVNLAIINKKCKILDLGRNQIISQGVIQIAESLTNNTTLQMLSLHKNSLSEISVQYLAAKLLLNDSALKWLDLESTDLTDNSAEYLAIMLRTNRSITGLWLSNNRIGYHGVEMLALALIYYNRTLKYLDLENNRLINDSCLNYLIDMLEQNGSLKEVYLNNCQLSMTSKIKLQTIAAKKQNFRLFL